MQIKLLVVVVNTMHGRKQRTNQRAYEPTHSCLRPSSDVVLLPRELNSGMKFDKSTAEARRLNQTFELSSALN